MEEAIGGDWRGIALIGKHAAASRSNCNNDRVRRPTMNLASWVLVGGVAGILTGIMFGESCAVLSPLGLIYVGLLQAAVYPYLICSLLHGLGSLDSSKAWRLFKTGWMFYVAAWVLTFACLVALTRAIPSVQPAIIGDTRVRPQSIAQLLDLVIPADLFTALSRNYVPAVFAHRAVNTLWFPMLMRSDSEFSISAEATSRPSAISEMRPFGSRLF
jgi:Sodium:dicarboxylate symporter family